MNYSQRPQATLSNEGKLSCCGLKILVGESYVGEIVVDIDLDPTLIESAGIDSETVIKMVRTFLTRMVEELKTLGSETDNSKPADLL